MRQHTGMWFGRRLVAALNMWLLIGLILTVFFSGQAFAAAEGDDFNDNIRDTKKWGTDEVRGRGRLNETGGRLEYVCATGSAVDSSDRPWILRQFPSTANWQITIDVTNKTSPLLNQWSSFGFIVHSESNRENSIEVELAAFEQSITKEFYAEFHYNGIYWGGAMQGTPDISAPIRMTFYAADKLFTVSGYTDLGSGPQWYDFGSFGVGPLGGGWNGNADWGLTPDDKFVAYVFGYSNNMVVKDGELYGDNFVEDGGLPWVGPALGPTGSYKFKFPTNNPLLTAIFNLTGHYQGFDSDLGRNYSMDVAQDESGKLSAMGTVDGVKNKDGGSDISGISGKITTVNGKPTVQAKSNFTGTCDGLPVTHSSTARISGDSSGVVATESHRGKLGGVPFKGTREVFDAPEGTVENVKQDWTLQLDIVSKQDSRGKAYLAASAQLVLPNGDTIVFPEKKTRYSTKTGYALSFSRGTNVTVIPQKVDTKTSISIKGMTLVKQQDGTWQPTAGTLTYKFFGQKGSGNLLDFIAP